jgi:hypothetical protein
MVKTAPSGDQVLRVKEMVSELDGIDERINKLRNDKQDLTRGLFRHLVDNGMFEFLSINRRALRMMDRERAERRPRS